MQTRSSVNIKAFNKHIRKKILKKKVVFLGGKDIGYECLALLFKKSEQLNINIIGVDTSLRGKAIKEFVLKHNLQYLDGIIPKCDIIISVQYHRVLSDSEIEMASECAINLHMAPLPEYRGCNQFSFAIIDGANEFGTTLHEMTPGIDAGSIIAESRFNISSDIWVKDLFDLTYDASVKLYKKYLPHIVSGEYNTIDQESLLSERKTSFHLRKDIGKIRKIDLNWDEDKINRHLRATMMPGFEPPYTMIGDIKIYFNVN